MVSKLNYDEKYDKAMRYLFGKTLICRNLDVATKLARSTGLDCVIIPALPPLPYKSKVRSAPVGESAACSALASATYDSGHDQIWVVPQFISSFVIFC